MTWRARPTADPNCIACMLHEKCERHDNPKPECPESPTGKHEFSPDIEYDPVDPPITCEHCGESPK